jgi:uncharacterized protein YuzE
MKLNYDNHADALYLQLDDSKILDSEEVAPGIILDFNEKNQVVGFEMLSLSKRTGAGFGGANRSRSCLKRSRAKRKPHVHLALLFRFTLHRNAVFHPIGDCNF